MRVCMYVKEKSFGERHRNAEYSLFPNRWRIRRKNLKGPFRPSDAQRCSSPWTGLLLSVCETLHWLLEESPGLVCAKCWGREEDDFLESVYCISLRVRVVIQAPFYSASCDALSVQAGCDYLCHLGCWGWIVCMLILLGVCVYLHVCAVMASSSSLSSWYFICPDTAMPVPPVKRLGWASSHIFVCIPKIPVEYLKCAPLGLQAFLKQWVLHCLRLLVRGRRGGGEILFLNSKIYLMLSTCYALEKHTGHAITYLKLTTTLGEDHCYFNSYFTNE